MMEFEGTRGSDDSHRGEAYDDTDEEDGPGMGGHRVGCSQQ